MNKYSVNGSNLENLTLPIELLRKVATMTNNVTVFNSAGQRIWWKDKPNLSMHERITDRGVTAQQMRDWSVNGKIWCQTGGRDCDHFQSTSSPFLIDANMMTWDRIVDKLYEYREGPVWYWLLPPDHEAVGSSRDLGMEAYENGHPHVIHVGL